MLEGVNTTNIATLIDIKHRNVKCILDELRFSKNSTKKELADKLSLSFATVSNTCNSLMAMGLLHPFEEDRQYRGAVGRTPKPVRLNPDRRRIIAFSLQTSGEVHIALVNLVNAIVAERGYRYDRFDTLDDFALFCRDRYADFIGEACRGSDADIIGVGAAVSGIFDRVSENIVASEIPLLENQPLATTLGRHLGKSVLVDNDTNLCALAVAKRLGAENLVYIYIGEGLGVGVVNRGEVVRGERGYGSEICHMPLGRRKRPCHLCGSEGCLETDVAVDGFLAKRFGEEALAGEAREILWARFMRDFNAGSGAARAVVEENADLLGRALSILANIFTPSRIVIGGVDRALFDALRPPILGIVNARRTVASMKPYELAFDPDPRHSLVKGASELVYSRWCPEIP